jgi:IS605 OrfB family transposase
LLNTITKGTSKEDEILINSQSVQAVYEDLLKKVKKHKKQIRFRSRKTRLGWIPFKGQTFKFLGNYSTYSGFKIRYWYHRPLPEGAVVKCGSISENSLGQWFLNLVVTFPEYLKPSKDDSSVGIDLGIISKATLSTGEKLQQENFSKNLETRLTRAQRRKKKRQVAKVNLKIKNKRKDWNHKATYTLAKKFKNIFVGDAKSEDILTDYNKINRAVYDASWYTFKTLLAYKVLRRQGLYKEVSETLTNNTCSNCTTIRTEELNLKIREWVCDFCNSLLDRDINAAKNILRFGSESLGYA